jgi:DNA-directed RNA polymerase specialized sigma24 family protein
MVDRGEVAGMKAAQESRLLSDRVLVERAGRGDQAAYDELYRRLAPGAWRLALCLTREPAMAAGAVATAFAATFGTAPPHPGTVSARARLLAAVRHAAVDPGLEPVAVGEIRAVAPSAVATAFAGLPARWRSTLWLLDAEGLTPRETAAALGLPEAAVVPLAARARAGLGEQVVLAEAAAVDAVECRRVLERLVDYASERLTARDERRVRAHLDGCDQCRPFLADLDDLTPALRRLAAPLPVAVAAASEDRWLASLVRPAGPLHLTLPSGRPVPAWAERAVAGAAAAVIALGIASAILVAGRGGRVRDDRLARSIPAEAPLVDGESALGGDSGLSGLLARRDSSPSSTSTVPGGASTPAPTPADVLPTRVAPVSAPPAAAPAPSAPPAAPAAGEPPAPAAPTTTAPEPVAEVTVGVGGVLGVVVGDQCTGLDLAGTVIGCAPTTTDEPLQVDLGGSLLGPLGL